MIAWMLLMMGLAGFSTLSGTGAQTPAALGQGATVTPASGWVSAQNVWNVGPNAVSLQHAGALVAFAADSYSGTNEQLLNEQLKSLQQQFGAFRSLPTAPATFDSSLPGLKVLFTGTSNSVALDGELVVGTNAGTGMVMLAVAPLGQLARVQPDLDAMLDSVVIP